jgi:hypothetical protein
MIEENCTIFKNRWNRYIEFDSKLLIEFTEAQLLAILDVLYREKIEGITYITPTQEEQGYIQKTIDLFNQFLKTNKILPLELPVGNIHIVEPKSLKDIGKMRNFRVEKRRSITIFDHIIIGRFPLPRTYFINDLFTELARIFGGYIFHIRPQADIDISLKNIKYWRGISSYDFGNNHEEFALFNDCIVDFFSSSILEENLDEFNLNEEEKVLLNNSKNSLFYELIRQLLIRSPHKDQILNEDLKNLLIQNYVAGRVKKIFSLFHLTESEFEILKKLKPGGLKEIINNIKKSIK